MDWRDNTKLHEQHTMSMAADENWKKNKNSVWIDYLDCEMKKKEIISKIRVVNSMLRSNFSPSNLKNQGILSMAMVFDHVLICMR